MTTPAATLDKNPLAAALNVGRIHPDNLAPLAWHLDELVASNIASTKLMADRHADTPLAGFHALSYQSEKEAYDNLQPFVQACDAPPTEVLMKLGSRVGQRRQRCAGRCARGWAGWRVKGLCHEVFKHLGGAVENAGDAGVTPEAFCLPACFVASPG